MTDQERFDRGYCGVWTHMKVVDAPDPAFVDPDKGRDPLKTGVWSTIPTKKVCVPSGR